MARFHSQTALKALLVMPGFFYPFLAAVGRHHRHVLIGHSLSFISFILLFLIFFLISRLFC